MKLRLFPSFERGKRGRIAECAERPFPNRDVAGRQEALDPLFVDAVIWPQLLTSQSPAGNRADFRRAMDSARGCPRRASATKRGCIPPHSAFPATLPCLLRSSFLDWNTSFAGQECKNLTAFFRVNFTRVRDSTKFANSIQRTIGDAPCFKSKAQIALKVG